MFNRCCVVGCASRRKDVNLYRFPGSETGLQKWLQCINCERLRSLKIEELRKQHVCQKHFEKIFLASSPLRQRLRVGAYPTLFSESEINSGIPQNLHTDTTSHLQDHGYSRKRKHNDHTYCKIRGATENHIRMDTETGIKQSSNNIEDNKEAALPSTSQPLNTKDGDIHFRPLTSVRRRKRIIAQKKLLSPTCAKLYSEYVKSQKQLAYHVRARRAFKFSKEKTFEKLTENLNPFAKKVLWMQIRQCTKKGKGRRFSHEEKLIALSVMKQSPKCYRFLQRIFILPSKCTLNKLVTGLDIETGINTQVFEAIKQEVKTWTEKKKYCSLIFDEIALESALTYDKKTDSIIGLVDLLEKKNELADHALVFLLRGAIYKWQQPLAYYFCKGAASAVELKAILVKIINEVSDIGLLPIAVVCDQGTAFQSALNSLQEDTRREQLIKGQKIDNVISLKGHAISIIYDPPHLIKGLRNNFLTKNIKYENKISKWDDIIDIYKTDCNHAQMRLLHKLNDEHVIPEKIKKMKVKNCVRVFSKTVAATLLYSAQFCKLTINYGNFYNLCKR
ncbi:uncharacterized protein LOC115444160 [Manduca sexta]|uniref:uncharacterized protein LOC115444160 n=1 Tax=Manduca sexta TaxID=7130 RepID=UPI00188EC513|nr:uncharacterized protein LOC115444160 [Manduca sexta]